MAKSDDSGNLSIDFLAGFSIFIIAFIWVVSMVPGLLINLQAYTIDYDAVAYRTSVILVEDPGASKYNTSSWEVVRRGDDYDPSMVQRFGLAVSRDAPNVLSLDKVNRFFDKGTFDSNDYYLNKAIFGDYPYRFNISLNYTSNGQVRFVGNPLPEGYGYIRRYVKVKDMSNMTIDGSDSEYDRLENTEKYIQGDNTTRIHFVSILLDNNNLTGKASPVKNPSYQVIPAQESIMINLTYLNNTMRNVSDVKMETCYDIMLNYQNVTVDDDSVPYQYLSNITIDEKPVWLKNTFTRVDHSVSILLNTTIDSERRNVDWDSDQVKVNLEFTLMPNTTTNPGCPCPVLGSLKDEIECSGSRFLNSSSKTSLTGHPIFYDYTTDRVTVPPLRDAILEVAVW